MATWETFGGCGNQPQLPETLLVGEIKEMERKYLVLLGKISCGLHGLGGTHWILASNMPYVNNKMESKVGDERYLINFHLKVSYLQNL